MAPARAAASPDAGLSSYTTPWLPPAGRGGAGGGVAADGGGGPGGGGGGGPLAGAGATPTEAIMVVEEGWPGGTMGPSKIKCLLLGKGK